MAHLKKKTQISAEYIENFTILENLKFVYSVKEWDIILSADFFFIY